jgi:hypothetical protein
MHNVHLSHGFFLTWTQQASIFIFNSEDMRMFTWVIAACTDKNGHPVHMCPSLTKPAKAVSVSLLPYVSPFSSHVDEKNIISRRRLRSDHTMVSKILHLL